MLRIDKEAPTISVVIPTFNRATYLVEAIESVFAQTHPVQEILVVDDGSDDETKDVVHDLKGPAPIRYFWQENEGPAAARNKGIGQAQGSWIALHDSDDLWVPEKIASQVAFHIKHPHLEFSFGQMVNFGEDGEEAAPEILDAEVYRYCRDHAGDLTDFSQMLLLSNPVPTPSVMFRRDSLERVGLMRENLRCAEDFEWWLRWAAGTRCGFLDQVLIKRRIHDANLVYDKVLRLVSHLEVLESLENSELSAVETAKLRTATHQQRYRVACEFFVRSLYFKALPHLRSVSPVELPTWLDGLKWLAKLLVTSGKSSMARKVTPSQRQIDTRF